MKHTCKQCGGFAQYSDIDYSTITLAAYCSKHAPEYTKTAAEATA